MRAYSKDLRERVILAVQNNEETQGEIAERFGVSRSFVEKLWHRLRTAGSFLAKAHGGGRRRTLREEEEWIRVEVKKQPDITLEELCDRIWGSRGLKASPSMMCRELKRLKLRLKKSRFMPASGKPLGFKRGGESLGSG